MGYSRFDGNQEELMESFEKHKKIRKKGETAKAYPHQIKSLLRKKMISSSGGYYVITARGKSAINQQIRKGEYWLSPIR